METSFRLLRQNYATFLTCVWRIRKIEQEFHDFVCVPPLTIGQEECLGPGFLNIVQNFWQSIVQLDVLCQVLDCHRLEVTLDVDMIHCPSDVLKQRFVGQVDRAGDTLESVSSPSKNSIFYENKIKSRSNILTPRSPHSS